MTIPDDAYAQYQVGFHVCDRLRQTEQSRRGAQMASQVRRMRLCLGKRALNCLNQGNR